MIDTILRGALHARLLVLILTGAVLAGGWYAFSSLTIEAFPDPTDTQVQVITLFPGQPAEEVERRISIPLERALNGLSGLYRLRSISLFGLSLVTLTFEEGVEPLVARQQVLERLQGVELPQGITPELGPLATPIGEIYRYTLEGPHTDPRTLRTLQDWVVRPALRRVSGVADVVSYGGLVQEIHVEPNPTRMAALGVVLNDLFSALAKASENASGGVLEQGAQGFVVRSLGTFNALDDLGEVRVGYHRDVPVKLRDVATITVGYAPRQGVVTRGTNQDAVEGIVLMRRGQNPSLVLAALRRQIEELHQRSLPADVRIVPFYDRTELVHTTLETVFRNLTEGALLVIGVLLVFLLSWRAALIVAVVIPCSLATAFIYLRSRGMSANLLSMGAVDFGIIVDGAVIMVEHLFGKAPGPYAAQATPEQRLQTLYDAAREVARPTLFSLLIIVAAYVPIFSLQRVEGRIFAPMAHTVVSSLVGALVASFTLVPVLCYYSLRRQTLPPHSPLLTWVQHGYAPLLLAAMRRPAMVLILAGCLVVAGLELAPRLGTEFLPELNEGSLYVTFTLPPTASLTEGRRLTPRIVRTMVDGIPEVTETLTQLGRPEDGTDPTLTNNLEVFVKLRPMHQWRPEIRTLNDLVERMDRNLKAIPGLEYNFSQPIRDNVAENISGQFGQVALKLYGDDLDQLQRLAEQVKQQLADVPGVADLGIVKASQQPSVTIRPRREALARWDLDLGDLQDYLETALSGHVAAELWEGEKRFDVTVRLPPAARESPETIRQLRVPLQDGAMVPVHALADVDLTASRAAITRENGKRYVGIRMNVRNRDLGSFVAEAQSRVAAHVQLPEGYHLLWGGEFENQQRAMQRLTLVLPLALLLTFFLLYWAFNSVWDAVLILVNLPVALTGGLFGLALAQMTLSVSAAVGFIALLGQAVLNGVLVISAIRDRLERGEDLWTACCDGARDRLRAVLMTALLASLGLLPAALSHAIGSETQRPIAVVVVAGTLSSALLTLIVLPVTYYWASAVYEAVRGGRRWASALAQAAS